MCFIMQTNSMSLNKKIISVLILFVSIFWYVVFSDAVNTRYTEFYFVSGWNNYETITVDLTWWKISNIDFYLENKTTSSLSVNMDFVDGWYTIDGSNIRFCKSENETSVFGKYVDMLNPSFSLNSNIWVTETLDLLFPSWYSGVYYWCVVYSPTVIEWSTYLNTVARKAIFLDVNVTPISVPFGIIVWPSDRSSSSKKWNDWKLMFYASNDTWIILYSGYLSTNTNGTWEFLQMIPDWYYDVVYKWQWHLSSYLDDVYITWWQSVILDFTAGANLYATKSYSDSIDDGYRYQIAWDLRNTMWIYDGKINVNDITMLVTSECNYNGWIIDQYQKCNLNGDSRVNMADIWVIITNISQEWIYLQWGEQFAGFEW
jgi:hypothetical protein